MMISLIAALSRNGVIGKNNTIPWKLPADMRHFRELTLGKPVIMGRKTFLSIGRPLPKRENIVMARDPGVVLEGCEVVHSAQEALKAAEGSKEVMVIGGEQIYSIFLPLAKRLYLTYIELDIEGDAFFPNFNLDEWDEIAREQHTADNENIYNYSFVILERKSYENPHQAN